MAVGYYFDTHSIAQPLLVNSADGGKTWSYPNVNKSLNLPSDYKHGHLYAASCSKSHCIAVGTYSNGFTDFPLVIHSKDGESLGTVRLIALHHKYQMTLKPKVIFMGLSVQDYIVWRPVFITTMSI